MKKYINDIKWIMVEAAEIEAGLRVSDVG